MANFAWDVRHFPDSRLFAAYLASIARPSWCTGLTLHHTAIPTVAQWRGRASMDGIGRYYRDQMGWSAGPQLFIGPDGIWQGTPVGQRGVHAGVCNVNRIGIEVVGNYDAAAWAEPIRSHVYAALVELLRWLRLDAARINGHRDCDSPKTCPGLAINLDAVRREVVGRMTPPPSDIQVIGVGPSITLAQFSGALTRHVAPLSAGEMDRIYRFCVWLDVDPAFLVALWKAEAGSPLGGSPLQQQTHQPINIKAAPGEWRPTVAYNSERWLWSETFQLGCYAAVLHLKNVHGATGRLTVGQIIPVHALASDGNDVPRIIAGVLEDMAYMEAH